MHSDAQWHIAIDTGGTFTDCLAYPADTWRQSREQTPHRVEARRVKILSSGALRGRVSAQRSATTLQVDASEWISTAPSLSGFLLRVLGARPCESVQIANHVAGERVIELRDPLPEGSADGAMFEVFTGESAPVLAARMATRTPLSDSLPPLAMRLATTRGTNALLERAGADVALFINEGFADLLAIGDQQRPDLFAIDITKPRPLCKHVVEVRGRLCADGSELLPIDLDHARDEARRLVSSGVRSAAIALMHSYCNPSHEHMLADVLREAGFECIACSAQLAPLIEILPRAETAVVEAYLAPIIQDYLDTVRKKISGGTLHVMTSAGGLVRADRYRAKDSLLSGPAGGVAGAAAAGRAAGCERIIGFDMGGTSTDVSRYDSDFEYRFEQKVGSARLVAPALAIETVAAGGGSICGFRDGRLFVGPESARADPGPACYGAGGPLTLTDVNLLMGRIDPELFEVPLELAHSQEALDAVLTDIQEQSGESPKDRDAILDGFLAIANERMAGAIRQVSLQRGYDPADYALVSFGGAGGQHACAIASMLGIKSLIMPADASILSAVGLDQSVIERFSQRQVLAKLDDLAGDLARMFDECAQQVVDEIVEEGIDPHRIEIRRKIANVRLLGQDATVAIEVRDVSTLAQDFAQRYEDMYGHTPEGKPIEIESIRVVASSTDSHARKLESERASATQGQSSSHTMRARFDGAWRDVACCRRDALPVGERLSGPALIFDQRSAYVIESGWTAEMDASGALRATQLQSKTSQATVADELVQMELFANRFASIAGEMGEILQRTALSTNVKRRLDFSCAVLDAQGELVVNAPHIPVHLGAMGLCVRSVADALSMKRGDVIVTNHPAFGGSHLPDITVVTPVFDEGDALLGYVANRAHHAEIGGSRPGSMPPMAKTLREEGVVIPPTYLVKGGQACFKELEQLLRSGPYPSRAVEDNLADLRAAVAANQRGAALLRALATTHGRDCIAQQMHAIKDHAAHTAQQAIAALDDGEHKAIERLDDGSPLSVALNIAEGRMTIDFNGTAPQHHGNLNATPAIVRSAILYVLRLLMGERGKAAGLNEGIMRHIEVVLPTGMLNPDFDGPPEQAPAVVGGNVETSQRVVDALLKPLNIAACSQGTMNNVLFGNEKFGYYETVCGGSGATAEQDGADAVHTHMTNTRITDPELMEHRYPVRLDRFAIRRGSGGKGKQRGGDGVVREMVFLEPVSLSILTQHRLEQPYGLAGGSPGACGAQRIIRATGERCTLKPVDQCDVQKGDRLILETPGGGGCFAPARASKKSSAPALQHDAERRERVQ